MAEVVVGLDEELLECRSRQPQKYPGVLQGRPVVEERAVLVLVVVLVVLVGSLHLPNHPGCLQVILEVVGLVVLVIEGDRLGVGVDVVVVVVGSLQPNQPGVLQLVVVVVLEVLVVVVAVVVLSKQPHQPGV